MSSLRAPKLGIIDRLKLSVRLIGMLVAFTAIVLVFTIWTDGIFVSSRSLLNISVQAVPVAIMA